MNQDSRLCPQCHNYFPIPRSYPNQKYCSVQCRDNARKRRVKVNCSNCGKPMMRKMSRANFEHFYCSESCLYKHQPTTRPSGKNHPQYKERKEYKCDYCGEPVYRLPNRIKKYVFCDVDCRLNWQRESGYMDAENSAAWLGGHDDSRGANWKRQRRKARKRDNFTCQRCGTTTKEVGKALDVHHIIPYRSFNGDWRSANHLDNLITYCNSCHTIVEWESGARVGYPTSD